MAITPETWDQVEVLLVYAAGILLYALVIAALYRVLARRIMFYSQQKGGRIVQRTALYIVTFPFVSFGFFLVLAESLLFMAPEKDPLSVFTVAMAIVLAVRVAAYISEHAAEDLAKTLPLGLLGVFLVTDEVTSLTDSFQKMQRILDYPETIGVFFGVVVAVEVVLRVFRLVFNATERKPGAHNP